MKSMIHLGLKYHNFANVKSVDLEILNQNKVTMISKTHTKNSTKESKQFHLNFVT